MIDPALASQVQALRSEASLNTVPSGLLAWWGNIDFPDGTSHRAPLSQSDWEIYYMRLQQAALMPATLAPLYLVKMKLRDRRPDGLLPVAIANFRIAVPHADIRIRVEAAAAAGLALDPPPGPLSTQIEERRVFCATGLLHEQWGRQESAYCGRSVTYLLDSEFYFTNAGTPPPDQVEIDPGDGEGFRSLHFGETLTAHYATGSEACATLRCVNDDGPVEARFKVRLTSQPAAPAPDETWPLSGKNRSGEATTGTAYVYRAPGREAIALPLLMAEGFPGGYPPDYLYDIFNQHGLADELRGAGYDLIVVGFDNGGDYIQNNAEVVVACIREVQARTTTALVVGGVSMGGLVSRYALATMEARAEAHNARIFLSIDTPHQGSYTNLCDQWFAHYFASSWPEAAMLAVALDSPANQQFSALWVSGDTVGPSPLRQEFLQDLAKIGGYPSKPRRLAVACGAGDGQRTIPPYQSAVQWTGSPFASAQLWTLPEGSGAPMVVAEGYSFLADPKSPGRLVVSSEYSWEGAPGGCNVYNVDSVMIAEHVQCGSVRDRIPVTCAVPTVSALDLAIGPFQAVPEPASGASPFHDYICCESNQQHLQFTPAVKRWLLERLAIPNDL